VAELGPDNWVTRFVEKPQSLDNNLVVVGCYYFQKSENLLAAIEEQIQRGLTFKCEYFLTDSITLMIGAGAKVRTERISSWLDTGTIDGTLETNRILLERGAGNASEDGNRPTVKIVPPVFIHPSAEVSESVIGPHVSIGAGCVVRQTAVSDSIIEDGTRLERTALTHSLIGRNCVVEGQPNPAGTARLNIGDNSSVITG
jgi:glucose-1-phosphate thymidylyltransferase